MSQITKENLQTALQAFNEDLGVFINNDQRHKLGRVLTIIDASIGDPEQRKAIKDLVNNEWWSGGNRPVEGRMMSPHTDLRGICRAFGFDLYDDSGLPQAIPLDGTGMEEFVATHYTKLIDSK
jgi:hypothetical protein